MARKMDAVGQSWVNYNIVFSFILIERRSFCQLEISLFIFSVEVRNSKSRSENENRTLKKWRVPDSFDYFESDWIQTID